MSLIGTKKRRVLTSVSANVRLFWFPQVLELSPKLPETNAENKTISFHTWRGHQTQMFIYCELPLKGVCT